MPGRATGSNVMPEMVSVTALRIRLTIISYESVSRMREFGSTADLDIFSVTSQRERAHMDGSENQRVRWLRDIEVDPKHPRTEHELRKLK